jgi:hypothetical protein
MSWRALKDEIARCADAGRQVEFWWRDDDATRPNAALDRLLSLSATSGVPLVLAVIPMQAESLGALGESICVVQHGADHVNRASPQAKKCEFPETEPVAAALARLGQGRAQLEALAGKSFLPVLAPPWNRLSRGLVPRLREAGYIGLSRYGARRANESADGLVQVNTHVDIIDWRGTRGFLGEEACIAAAVAHLAARRAGSAEPTEPTGWLTHHAVHDAAAWDFLARLFEFTRSMKALAWRNGQDIFHRN